MSQSISLCGANYTDVPAVDLPITGGGTARFTDVTDTTAAASDVASGKYFYTAAGVRTAGTSSGGGGTLKIGVIRPDAQLVQTWSYDKLIHADEGVTIPAYTTTEQTLKASATLAASVSLNTSSYDYFFTFRGIAAPVYSSNTKGAGRFVYSVSVSSYELVYVPKSLLTDGGNVSERHPVALPAVGTGFNLYWRNASAIRSGSSVNSGGAYLSPTTPVLTASVTTDNQTVEIKSPKLCLRGSTTYLTSTYWGYITDIRYQYIIQLWRAPRTGDIEGWALTSQAVHAAQCASSVSGTLT